VRAYADSSFILRLVTTELESTETVAEYRRLGKEVRNSILQRAFHQRRSILSGERQHVARERDAALARLEHLIARRTLLEVSVDMDATFSRATEISATHGERLGARAIDLLHVAAALTLESELFLTTDARQAQIAKAEGLKTASLG
jgi:predicted nucleic acid-binding protein